MKISVIIPAAGNSSRMGSDSNKVLLPLAGKTVLDWSLAVFQHEAAVEEIILASRLCDISRVKEIAAAYSKVKAVVPGGESRSASVTSAMNEVSGNCSHIAVHDGARPLLTALDLKRLILAAKNSSCGAILAAPVTDSIRIKGSGDILAGIANRDDMLAAQTPQLFPADILKRAYAQGDIAAATDESQLVAALGLSVAYVFAREANFKMTVAEDMIAAAAILEHRQGISGRRIHYGLGWDSHRQVTGRPLVLGGVKIPYDKGLLAHSDGDVLLHAVIDAMLGAASLPDIGRQFPDTDPYYKDISSMLLLKKTACLIQKDGWAINNIDADIIAESPRLAPYIDQIRASIAAGLDLPPDRVCVKAKTAEGMGLIGSGEAMAALAIVSLNRE